MLIIRNRLIPFGSYYAINIFGIVFCKGDLLGHMRNHEYIHTLQQREMLFVLFYLWYVAEWLVRLVQYRNLNRAYRNISFEREAYARQHNLAYARHRRFWAWCKYLRKR